MQFRSILRTLLISLLTVVAALLAATAPALWSVGTICWYEDNAVPFDRQIWHKAESEDHSNYTYVRLQMASSLVEKNALDQLHEKDVIEMLGEATNYPEIPGSSYWLAPFGMDSMWLQITYQDGKVAEAAIKGD